MPINKETKPNKISLAPGADLPVRQYLLNRAGFIAWRPRRPKNKECRRDQAFFVTAAHESRFVRAINNKMTLSQIRPSGILDNYQTKKKLTAHITLKYFLINHVRISHINVNVFMRNQLAALLERLKKAKQKQSHLV